MSVDSLEVPRGTFVLPSPYVIASWVIVEAEQHDCQISMDEALKLARSIRKDWTNRYELVKQFAIEHNL